MKIFKIYSVSDFQKHNIQTLVTIVYITSPGLILWSEVLFLFSKRPFMELSTFYEYYVL